MKKIILITISIIMSLSLFSCDTQNSFSIPQSNNENEFIVSNTHDDEKEPFFTIIFETNGGTAISKINSNKIDKAPYTSKAQHLFDGWFLDSTFTQAAIFPLTVKKDTTLYARWLKIESTVNCSSAKIKMSEEIGSTKVFQATPSGFDINRLQQLGYTKIKITVNYNVRYQKDYNVLWDVGYLGSPRYEIYLLNSSGVGDYQEDVKTTKNATAKSLETSILLSDIYNDKITLTVSTNNIQNIIHFENIVITYKCYK